MENTLKRNVQSDLIRIVAMLLVIVLHNSYILPNYESVATVCFACNILFFILSGKYNLRFCPKENEKEAYILFYKRRFISIVVPFIIYTFIYTECKYRIWSISVFPLYLKNLIQMDIHDIYWFMYALIGLILSTPFWAKLVNNLSDFELKLIISIALIWNLVSVVIIKDLLGLSFGFTNWILTGYSIDFVLGYASDRLIKTRKQEITVILLGVIGFAITFCRIRFFTYPEVDLYAYSPFFALYALGIYIFLERILLVKSEKIQRIITFFAKYSFSVYLIHPIVLGWLNNGEKVLQFFPNISIFILWIVDTLITIFISLLVAIVLDNSVIKWIKKILELI